MRFVSIDLETTGLNPAWHDICEFGWAVGEDSGAFFVQFDMVRADPKAMEFNNVLERRKNPAAWRFSHKEAIRAMDKLFDPEQTLGDGTMIVCSPSFFDMGFLQQYWLRHVNEVAEFDAQPPWGHRNIIDLKSMAAGLGYAFGGKNSEIGEWLGVPDTSNHTAEQDAQHQLQIFNKLKERLA